MSSQANETEVAYAKARFEALCGNADNALKLLEETIQKKLRAPRYIACGWDFDLIKDDPRFKELTGSV